MQRITFLPVSAAATVAPVVPTFPKTLASSMAAALAMVRPTKWIRRKCTMRATVTSQLAVAEVPFSFSELTDFLRSRASRVKRAAASLRATSWQVLGGYDGDDD